MKLVEKRLLTTTDGLSAGDLAQLDAIAVLYFGSAGPVTIDDDFDDDPLAARVLMTVDVWKVMDGATHAYDVWTYMGDSGTVFRAGTNETVAEIIQGGLECDDETLGDALDLAIHEAYNPKKATKAKAKAKAKPAAKKPAPKKKTAAKPAKKAKTKTKATAKTKTQPKKKR